MPGSEPVNNSKEKTDEKTDEKIADTGSADGFSWSFNKRTQDQQRCGVVVLQSMPAGISKLRRFRHSAESLSGTPQKLSENLLSGLLTLASGLGGGALADKAIRLRPS